MPAPLDHALALLVAVLWPLWEYFVAEPSARRAIRDGPPGMRSRFYGRTVAKEWLLAAAVMAWWFHSGRSAESLGLSASSGLRFGIGLALAVGVLLLQALQIRAVARSQATRDRLAPRLARLSWMLPHTGADLRVFQALSATAGLCEELLYRGYLLAYLRAFMPFAAAIAVSSVLFGLGHAYQGPRGMLQTAVIGLAMGGLYALTGSLWVPMLVHASVDLGSGFLTYLTLREISAPPIAME